MIKVAIVEDEDVAAKHLEEYFDMFSSAHDDTQFAVTRFKNGVTFLAAEGSDFDLVFMDIEMPSLNGMETAND